jgi:hypothetical protein
MAQIFNIQDDKVVISKLALKYLEGSVIHAGSFDIAGNASVQSNLTVKGTITVDTLTVKNLVTEAGSAGEVGQWTGKSEIDLQGKGFRWTSESSETLLTYRAGNRLWSNANIDSASNGSYRIDDIGVLTANELGPTVIKSNLKQVGTLRDLKVTGDATIGEFAFFNSGFGRLGINTDEPTSALSIVDNEVEITIGSPDIGIAAIGTRTNHHVAIVTDNTERVTVKNNGEVIIGNEESKTGVLRVYGTLFASNIVADTRVERSTSLEFKATRDTSSYGKGLVWTGNGTTKQFILMANPDRVWSSESLGLAEDRAFLLGDDIVLSRSYLGETVRSSSLTKVGTLTELSVSGDVTLGGNVSALSSSLAIKEVVLNDGDQQLTITSKSINSDNNVCLTVGTGDVFYADREEITIGNKSNTRRAVKVYGPLSVGITTPDPTVGLAVAGDFSFADKKFFTGSAIPTSGTFNKGDICWNSNPAQSNYIGWVCIIEGTPGEWLPFGTIG